MQGYELVLTLESLICLVFMIWLLLHLWPSHRLDRFRQDVFSLRDEIWDYAADGNISFDDPAYRLLRQLMNGFIRYAHHVTFYRVCMSLASHSSLKSTPLPVTWTAKWNNAIENVEDEDVRKKLLCFHSRLMVRVSRRLVFGSPVLLPLALVCLVVMLMHQGLVNLQAQFREAINNTANRLVNTKILEEEAAGMVAVS